MKYQALISLEKKKKRRYFQVSSAVVVISALSKSNQGCRPWLIRPQDQSPQGPAAFFGGD